MLREDPGNMFFTLKPVTLIEKVQIRIEINREPKIRIRKIENIKLTRIGNT